MNDLSLQNQRIVAVLLLVLLIAVLATYIVAPVLHYYGNKYAEVNQLQMQLQRYQQLVDDRQAIEDYSRQTQRPEGSDTLFLNGGKPSLVSASLQDFVSGVLQKHGGQLLSSQSFKTELLDAGKAIGLRLQIHAGLPELVSFLYALENSRPLIFVENITIASGERRVNPKRKSNNAIPNNQKQRLTVTMDVVAFQKVDG